MTYRFVWENNIAANTRRMVMRSRDEHALFSEYLFLNSQFTIFQMLFVVLIFDIRDVLITYLSHGLSLITQRYILNFIFSA